MSQLRIRPERTGRTFEQTVFGILQGGGAHLRRGRDACAGRTCFETAWYVDAILDNAHQFPQELIVECKWQESDGSADEKYNHLVANIYGATRPAVIVTGGRGARQVGAGARLEALAWLHRQVDHQHLIAVMTIEELLPWLRTLTFDRRSLFV